MRSARPFLCSLALILVLMVPTLVNAQQWAGIIAPSRATDWTVAGVSGGIPSGSWTQCGATMSSSSTAAQIQSRIQGCAANTYVLLAAGTFNLSSGIDWNGTNGVVLRGAGAGQTKLVFTGNTGCNFSVGAELCFRNGENVYGPSSVPNSANWTAGYSVGTTSITLSSVANLKVGSLLMLDQLDDSSDGWPATGDIYNCNSCSKQGGNSFGRPGRGQIEDVTITSISGNTVTFTPGLIHNNWRSGQSPGAWWGNSLPIKNVGVENLTIDDTATGSPPVMFFNAVQSWVKGVRSVENSSPSSTFSHVRMMNNTNITIRDSYFYGPVTNATDTYGITCEQCSHVLVENNIIISSPGPMEHNGSDAGSVWSYNYGRTGWANTQINHEQGPAYVLYEGNDGTGATHDLIHGSSNFMTDFRNLFVGGVNGSTNHTIIWLMTYHRFFNIIGNVLGDPTNDSVYQVVAGSQNGNEIYVLGENCASCSGGNTVPLDSRVSATLMRWGNYDTVNAAVRFVNAEVPSSITNFSNPLPASQTLPASFYLSGKPSWFGSVPYPPVGPDVTGGNVSGYAGHAYKIPARLCSENTAIDPAYGASNVLAFSASTCYPSTTASGPTPPSGLQAVVN
jgi:hypothetical protein